MKSRNVAIAIAVLALPIYAADQPRTNTNTTTTTLSAPVTQEATDSPLVRAAKATGRLGKKPGYVITNDMLLRVGSGHMSISTATQAPLPAIQPKAPVATPQRQMDAKPKGDTQVRTRPAHQLASDYYGESAEPRHDDPAMQERQMQQTATQKPPQE